MIRIVQINHNYRCIIACCLYNRDNHIKVGSCRDLKIIEPEVPYIISTNTLILQTTRNENSLCTLIIERDEKFIHPRKVLHLIRASCRHYGTSFKMATSTAKSILNNRHKVPIVIAFDRGTPLIMIPTLSATSEQNIWIAFHAITNFFATGDNCTTIELANRYTVKLSSSETTIQRQIALAHLLQKDYQMKFYQFNGAWLHKPTHIY